MGGPWRQLSSAAAQPPPRTRKTTAKASRASCVMRVLPNPTARTPAALCRYHSAAHARRLLGVGILGHSQHEPDHGPGTVEGVADAVVEIAQIILWQCRRTAAEHG